MCDVLITAKILSIRNKFMCCIPVHEIELQDFLSSISWDQQLFLLEQTVQNSLLRKFPLKTSYQKSFLKTLINILEKNCKEIHDNLYDAYCNILSCDDSEKYYYKHYIIGDKIISLKENKSFISEGTTGLCTWQASLALSQWCINNKEKLSNKKILELGSGVGLVGLTIHQHCQPDKIILSDCHPEVLTVLSENVAINTQVLQQNITSDKVDSFAKNSFVSSEKTVKPFDSSGKTVNLLTSDFNLADCENKSDYSTVFKSDATVFARNKISVVNLPWEQVNNNSFCEHFTPDFILAADVVYDNSVFEPLCGAVKYFTDRNPACKVVFACTERNSDTLQEFLDLLETNKFRITNLESPEPKDFFWSTAVPIRFYLVTAQ